MSSVYAYYLDKEGKAVGKVSFEIDWELYEMYATTEAGREIVINNKISLMDQFANWTNDIVYYVKK